MHKKWIILLTVLLVASLAANIVLAVALRNKSDNAASSGGIDPGNVPLVTGSGENNTVIGEAMPTDDCFPIESDHCLFYLPKTYYGKIVAENKGESVACTGIIDKGYYPLYSVDFNAEDGMLLGYLNNGDEKIKVSVSYADYSEFYDSFTQEQKDEYDSMIETVNVLNNQFTLLDNYSAS